MEGGEAEIDSAVALSPISPILLNGSGGGGGGGGGVTVTSSGGRPDGLGRRRHGTTRRVLVDRTWLAMSGLTRNLCMKLANGRPCDRFV